MNNPILQSESFERAAYTLRQLERIEKRAPHGLDYWEFASPRDLRSELKLMAEPC